MRKMNRLAFYAAVLTAGFAGLSCNRMTEDILDETSRIPENPTLYTLTVKADKGASTKALTEDGGILKSSWSENDEVAVYNVNNALLGTLRAAASSTGSTTLSGNLTTAPAVGEALVLKYRTDSYTTQRGTLDYIASHCDHAVASVIVETVVGKAITTTEALFQPRQAIVKFSLQNTSGSALSASQLLVNSGTSTYTVDLQSASSTVYVALPAIANQNLSLFAKVGTDYYDLAKTGVTFENGAFYRITPRLTKQPLSSVIFPYLEFPTPEYFYGGASGSEAI